MERGSLALVLGTKFPVDKLESLHPSLEPFLVGLEHFVGKLGQDLGQEGGGGQAQTSTFTSRSSALHVNIVPSLAVNVRLSSSRVGKIQT